MMPCTAGRAELQSWWDELQECERNLQESLSDPGSGSTTLSGKSSFRTVQSSSDSGRSVQAGRNCSQEQPHRTISELGCKDSSDSGEHVADTVPHAPDESLPDVRLLKAHC